MWFRWLEIARQLCLLWGHMKYTVQFCEVFMVVCDIQTYSCFELSLSSNVQEKHNILEDNPCGLLREPVPSIRPSDRGWSRLLKHASLLH